MFYGDEGLLLLDIFECFCYYFGYVVCLFVLVEMVMLVLNVSQGLICEQVVCEVFNYVVDKQIFVDSVLYGIQQVVDILFVFFVFYVLQDLMLCCYDLIKVCVLLEQVGWQQLEGQFW